MIKDTNIIIIGYSGHAYNIIDVLISNGFKINGYIDNNENKLNPFNLTYLGNDEDFISANKFNFSEFNFFPAVGNEIIRSKIINKYDKYKANWINVFHKNICLSERVTIENAVYIASGVIVNVFSKINKGVILNTGCIIEHECEIGDSSQIATGATLAGDVKIGKRTFIGANSVIRQGVRIGNDVVVGAGSVVLNDINDNEIVVGNPSKFLRQNLEK